VDVQALFELVFEELIDRNNVVRCDIENTIVDEIGIKDADIELSGEELKAAVELGAVVLGVVSVAGMNKCFYKCAECAIGGEVDRLAIADMRVLTDVRLARNGDVVLLHAAKVG